MTPTEFKNAVASEVDTEKTKIGVADVSRVHAVSWKILSELPTHKALELLAKLLAPKPSKK